jgi:predicted AlkP superfamily pyrophosphatase or phosphodiesterase
MHRNRLVFAALLVSFAGMQAQTPSVLMISVDGMRPDYVTQADEHGLKLPTLRSFMRRGAYAEGVTGVFPTITYPSHTTIVTGVWPAEHGIVNNQRFDPQHDMGGAWFWYEDQIKVPTLWSVAHGAGLSTASVGWPVTADAKDIDFLIPEYWRSSVAEPTNPDDRLLINALSRPVGELERIAGRMATPYMEGNDTSAHGDEIKTLYALDILKQHKPKFMTIHLSSLDEEQHLHGPFSVEANEDLEQLDGMIARLADQERANDPRAVVVVVSDHGFADVDQQLNLGAAFVEAGLMTPSAGGSASPVQWKAQPWGLGCMFAVMLRDPDDDVAKQKVHSVLVKLAADHANGIEDVFDAAQVADLGGVPEASFVVTLRKGYAPGANLSGPLVTAIPGHRGTHGYNPQTTPEMRASFFIEGPSITAAKDLGIVDMRGIAPTIAKMLGLTLPRATQVPFVLR